MPIIKKPHEGEGKLPAESAQSPKAVGSPAGGPALFEHGSVWARADFHMHTPADKEFSYTGDPNVFVSEYVAALKSADIRVAVITNHNNFDRDEFKRLARHARKQEVFLLPGLELSVKDGSNGIHTLVVFSDEWISNPKTPIMSNPF